MVSDWIDKIAQKWESLEYEGKTIRSYKVYERGEIPESLSPEVMPCAITIMEGSLGDYAAGGSWEYIYGRTEFHLVPTAAKEHTPRLLDFYRLIRDEAVTGISLGGTVDLFSLRPGEGELMIRGPVEMQYGDEPWHWGFVVTWQVKENVSTEVTVAV
jgi:hypothetical protein